MKNKFTYSSILLVLIAFSSSLFASNSAEIDTLKLENNHLSVLISTKGAEILSIKNKKDNKEVMWYGDKKYWDRHAPLLFPVVGKLKNKKYTLDGKTYKLPLHGFAGKSVFSVVSKTKNELVLKLTESEETLKMYPYKFNLQVKYELVGSKLNITNTVTNTNNKDMYFSIGAHPGFNVPINKDEKYDDYYIEFEKKETAYRLPLSEKKGLLSNKRVKYLDNTNRLNLNHKMFDVRVIILEDLKSDYLVIKSDKSDIAYEIGIKDFPLVGIWTSAKSNAPFVCIEPWYGVSDTVDSTGDLKKKKGIQKLSKNESFDMKYYIKVINN